jgi:caa(3)-type oxidase subunit IV
MKNKDMANRKSAAYNQGIIIFVVLMALTIAEYFVSFVPSSTIPLFVIAILKAGAIMQYFMHIYKLWSKGENH